MNVIYYGPANLTLIVLERNLFYVFIQIENELCGFFRGLTLKYFDEEDSFDWFRTGALSD